MIIKGVTDNISFKSKTNFLDYVGENKEKIIDTKKSIIKMGYLADFFFKEQTKEQESFLSDFLFKNIEENQNNTNILSKKLAINSTNYLDSHQDLHIKGIWDDSIPEVQGKIYLVNNHELNHKEVIAYPESINISTKIVSFRSLGVDSDLETQLLVFDAEIKQEINSLMYERYLKGLVKQHSIRMSYVGIQMALKSDSELFVEENYLFEKFLKQMANPEIALSDEVYWIVSKANIKSEGSSVIFGSNKITPVLN